MLGTNPRKIDAVAPLLAPILDEETLLISILAGIELSSLRARFPTPRTIVKAMPNTPAKLGKGVTNLCTDSEAGHALALVEGLMAALGTLERFDDEALFQIAGILSGAGPAFLFRFIDALAAGGETLGLSKDQAGRLAKAMVEGAAALAASEAESPAQRADRGRTEGKTSELQQIMR